MAIETIGRQDARFSMTGKGRKVRWLHADGLQYAYWPELYCGIGGLVSLLRQVKKKYDPNNVFHVAKSIRA